MFIVCSDYRGLKKRIAAIRRTKECQDGDSSPESGYVTPDHSPEARNERGSATALGLGLPPLSKPKNAASGQGDGADGGHTTKKTVTAADSVGHSTSVQSAPAAPPQRARGGSIFGRGRSFSMSRGVFGRLKI